MDVESDADYQRMDHVSTGHSFAASSSSEDSPGSSHIRLGTDTPTAPSEADPEDPWSSGRAEVGSEQIQQEAVAGQDGAVNAEDQPTVVKRVSFERTQKNTQSAGRRPSYWAKLRTTMQKALPEAMLPTDDDVIFNDACSRLDEEAFIELRESIRQLKNRMKRKSSNPDFKRNLMEATLVEVQKLLGPGNEDLYQKLKTLLGNTGGQPNLRRTSSERMREIQRHLRAKQEIKAIELLMHVLAESEDVEKIMKVDGDNTEEVKMEARDAYKEAMEKSLNERKKQVQVQSDKALNCLKNAVDYRFSSPEEGGQPRDCWRLVCDCFKWAFCSRCGWMTEETPWREEIHCCDRQWCDMQWPNPIRWVGGTMCWLHCVGCITTFLGAESFLGAKSTWSTRTSADHDFHIEYQKAAHILGGLGITRQSTNKRFMWSLSQFFQSQLNPEHMKSLKKRCSFLLDVKIYFDYVRVRVVYMCFLSWVLTIALFAGLLIETFMSTFTPLTWEYHKLFYVYLAGLPFLMILFAYFSEGMIVLALDAGKSVPLVEFQAALLHGIRCMTLERFFILLGCLTVMGVGNQAIFTDRDKKLGIMCCCLFIEFQACTDCFRKGSSWKPWKQKVLFMGAYIFLVCFTVTCVGNQTIVTDDARKFAILCCFLFAEFLALVHCTRQLKDTSDQESSSQQSVEEELRRFRKAACVCIFFAVIVILHALGPKPWTLLTGLSCMAVMLFFDDKEHNKEKEPPHHWECLVVDTIVLVLLELIPLGGGIWGAVKHWLRMDVNKVGFLGSVWRSYLWGSVFGILSATTAFQVCIAFFALRSSKYWKRLPSKENVDVSIGTNREIYRGLARAMWRHRLGPGMLTHLREVLAHPDVIVSHPQTDVIMGKVTLRRPSDDGQPSLRRVYTDPLSVVPQSADGAYKFTSSNYVAEKIETTIPCWKILWSVAVAVLIGLLIHCVQREQSSQSLVNAMLLDLLLLRIFPILKLLWSLVVGILIGWLICWVQGRQKDGADVTVAEGLLLISSMFGILVVFRIVTCVWEKFCQYRDMRGTLNGEEERERLNNFWETFWKKPLDKPSHIGRVPVPARIPCFVSSLIWLISIGCFAARQKDLPSFMQLLYLWIPSILLVLYIFSEAWANKKWEYKNKCPVLKFILSCVSCIAFCFVSYLFATREMLGTADWVQWVALLCPTFLLVAHLASEALMRALPLMCGRNFWLTLYSFGLLFAMLLFFPSVDVRSLISSPYAAVTIVNKSLLENLGCLKNATNNRCIRKSDYVDFDRPRDSAHEYSLCKVRYGQKNAELTALDVAQLAGLAYDPSENCTKGIAHRLKDVFDQTGLKAKVHYCVDYSKIPRIVVFDIGGTSTNMTRVIAIRGTSTLADLYVDLTFYSTIKVLQLFELVLPVIDFFPLDQMQWFLRAGHLYGQLEAESCFWTESEAAAKRFISECDNCTAMLTGHSLGGAFAQVLASRLNLPALVFSSPGVKFSADRFGVFRKRFWSNWHGDAQREVDDSHFGIDILKAKVRNVIPAHDAVPQVDGQISLIDPIQCDSSVTQCHRLNRTSCEIWRACGDIYHRVFNCSAYVRYGDINHFIPPDDKY